MPTPYPKRSKKFDANRTFGVRSGVGPRDAGALAGKNAVGTSELDDDAVTNGKLGQRAASSTAWDSRSYGPYNTKEFINTKIGGSTQDDPGRELLTTTATLTAISPGDPLLVLFDYNLIFDGALAQHLCFHTRIWIMRASDTFNNDYYGTGSDDYNVVSDASRKMTRIFDRMVEVQTDQRSGGNLSLEANNSSAKLSAPGTSGMTITAAPSDADTVDYKVVCAFVFDRDKIGYSSGNEYGQKSEDNTKQYRVNDFDLVVMNLKEKQ